MLVCGGLWLFAALAERARDLLVAGRGAEIGPLLSENFDLRTRLINVSAGNRALVQAARDLGACAKLAGSGGAVVGTYDGDPQRLAALGEAYAALGATLIEPQIAADPQGAAA